MTALTLAGGLVALGVVLIFASALLGAAILVRRTALAAGPDAERERVVSGPSDRVTAAEARGMRRLTRAAPRIG